MQSPCLKEVTELRLSACWPNPLHKLSAEHHRTISNSGSAFAACRRDFAATTSSSIFPNTEFTNYESLPSLQESFTDFTKVYSKYHETEEVDQIRAKEYSHLSQSNHTCLDYIGIGLFSSSQLHKHESSPQVSSDFPFFSVSYKTGSLKTQLLHGAQESELESAMSNRIMEFLNISANDYSMVFTANRTSAFKLVAESYPFKTSRKLLTVYDYESEAVEGMINSSEKRGAKAMAAEFSWPRLRIQSAKLRKMVVSKRKKKKKRGLFVFPVHSRITGSRYPYVWMTMAQENGWHVLVDACALGPKDMDSFGLSLFQPDFLISSFYKICGENPSGFACLFVRKSVVPVLEVSTSTGIVNLVPAKQLLQIAGDSSGTDTELEQICRLGMQLDALGTASSFSGLISNHTTQARRMKQERSERAEEAWLQLHSDSWPTSKTYTGFGLLLHSSWMQTIVSGMDGENPLKVDLFSKDVQKHMDIVLLRVDGISNYKFMSLTIDLYNTRPGGTSVFLYSSSTSLPLLHPPIFCLWHICLIGAHKPRYLAT